MPLTPDSVLDQLADQDDDGTAPDLTDGTPLVRKVFRLFRTSPQNNKPAPTLMETGQYGLIKTAHRIAATLSDSAYGLARLNQQLSKDLRATNATPMEDTILYSIGKGIEDFNKENYGRALGVLDKRTGKKLESSFVASTVPDITGSVLTYLLPGAALSKAVRFGGIGTLSVGAGESEAKRAEEEGKSEGEVEEIFAKSATWATLTNSVFFSRMVQRFVGNVPFRQRVIRDAIEGAISEATQTAGFNAISDRELMEGVPQAAAGGAIAAQIGSLVLSASKVRSLMALQKVKTGEIQTPEDLARAVGVSEDVIKEVQDDIAANPEPVDTPFADIETPTTVADQPAIDPDQYVVQSSAADDAMIADIAAETRFMSEERLGDIIPSEQPSGPTQTAVDVSGAAEGPKSAAQAGALTGAEGRKPAVEPEPPKPDEPAEPPTPPDTTNVKLVQPDGSIRVTGIKNAAVDAELEKMGLPPAEHGESVSDKARYATAKAVFDADPFAGQRLVDDLAATNRPPTGDENALLTFEINRLIVAREVAQERLVNAAEGGDESSINAAMMFLDNAQNAYERAADIVTKAGTESSASLRLRKMMLARDYSLAAIEARWVKAKGSPLTPEQRAEIAKLHEQLKAAEKAQAEAQEKNRKLEIENELLRLTKEAAKDDPAPQKRKGAIASIKAKVADGAEPSELGGAIQQLFRNAIASGRSRDQAVDDVFEAIKDIVPGITRSQTVDAISGYGKWRPLSKDELDIKVRQAKGELLQLAKLEDIIRKLQAPLKTGQERQEPSDEQRRLTKEVHETMKRLGIVTGDPATQLKGALDSRKTYIKNRMADLRAEIAAGERAIKDKSPGPTDAELESLKAEYEIVKAEHEAVFAEPEKPKTNAERVKDAKESIKEKMAAIRAQIVKGEREKSATGKPLQDDAELSRLREELDALNGLLDAYLPEGVDPFADAKRADAAEQRLTNEIAALNDQINAGERAAKAKPSPVNTEQVNKLRAIRDAKTELLDKMFPKPKRELTDEQRIGMAIASTERSIVEYERRIKAGELKTPKTSKTPSDPRLAAVRARRDALKSELHHLRDLATLNEAHAEKVLSEKIESRKAILDRIKAGEDTRKAGTPTVDTAEVSRLKTELKSIDKEIADLRRGPKRTPEEIARSARRTRMTNRLAELQDKIARGDYSKTPRREPAPLTAEEVQLAEDIEKVKRQVRRGEMALALANRTMTKKVTDGLIELIQLPKAMFTIADASGFLRQGIMFTAGHPIESSKLAIRSIKAAGYSLPGLRRAMSKGWLETFQYIAYASPDAAMLIDTEIRGRPGAAFGEASKLTLTRHGDDPGPHEEAIRSRFSDYLPLSKPSNNNFITFLNLQRATRFDAMVRAIPDKPTLAQGKAIAYAVGLFTGRGSLGKYDVAMSALAVPLWSPRLLLSRFQILTLQPLRGGDWTTRKIIAKEYGRSLIGILAFYGLVRLGSMMFSDDDKNKPEVTFDPRSSDFGKVRMGNTRLDPLAGLSQVTVLLTRVGYGETVTGSGEVRSLRGDGGNATGDVIGRFLRTKLSPTISIPYDLMTGKDIVGNDVTVGSSAKNLLVPLAYRDIYDVMLEQGVPEGTALGILSFFGMGLQHYEQRRKSKTTIR